MLPGQERPREALRGTRRSPAPPPEASARRHEPAAASRVPPPAPQSPLVCATRASAPDQRALVPPASDDTGVAVDGAADVAYLLRHAVVRELVRENEGMLMELAGLRAVVLSSSGSAVRLLRIEERAARATLATAEAATRTTLAARAHAALAVQVRRLEVRLCEEAQQAAQLRGFAELAQAQLGTSPRPPTQAATPDTSKYTRPARGSGAVDVDPESRRGSLEEITNVRGSLKRLRSVESSDGGGTPRHNGRLSSASQRSPGALTKMRKTMH